MQIDLKGKTAVISGSSAGIGYATALGLAKAGARIILNGRNPARVDDAAKSLRAAVPGVPLETVAADVGTAAGCDAIVAKTGEADILVNNAGIFEVANFFDIADAEWIRFFENNVMSGIRLARAFMPGMLKRNWGRIVFISSESGVHIPKEMIHYGVTKTAQLSVSRGLAELTQGTGVTVNSVLPGPTRSDGVEGFLQGMAKQTGMSPDQIGANFIKEHRSTSLIGRFASVEEVANMIVYTCSKEASATNGAALRVDGGVVRTVV